MLKKERQTLIMEKLEARKYCTVGYLAKELYFAPVTIRRDLAEMEKQGLLTRCHGGAAVEDSQNRTIPFEVRERSNSTEKAELGRQAARLIHHGDVVFLDASSTVAHIADHITADQNLTVITNSTKLLDRLMGKGVKCYLTGGKLLENSYALVGCIAENTVSTLYADIFFFSSQGITEDGIITDYSDDETTLRRLMIRHAAKSVFVCDKSKLGNRYLFKVCDAKELFAVVSDFNFEKE